MEKNIKKTELRLKKKYHIRKKIFGTSKRPRLSVFKSNSNFYAQVINDELGKTIVSSSTLKMKDSKSNIKTTKLVANELVQKMKKKKVNCVVFDRNGYIYHGKIKAFAEILRKEGIQF